MSGLINKNKVKKQWENFLNKEEFVDQFCFYRAIKNTAQSMMLQMVDFLFIEGVYDAFMELLELNNNIDIMLCTDSEETVNLCKQRINYLLKNKIDNWYI